MSGHKKKFKKFYKFKKIGTISSIFSDHNSVKLEIKNRSIFRNFINTWKLNNMLMNKQRVNEEIKSDTKSFLETNEIENTIYQKLWDTEKSALKEKFIEINAYILKEE